MADLRDKIEAEFENIELLLKEIPPFEKLPRLSFLELAGVATLHGTETCSTLPRRKNYLRFNAG